MLAKNSIFISYRKDDSGGWAPRLAEELRAITGEGAVFLDDTTGIPYGTPWPAQISTALDQCRIFLPVIAPNWSTGTNLTRLKEPEDWVRKELITTHHRQPSVLSLPVFVNRATPVDANLFQDDAELHTAMVELMSQQGLTLDRSTEHWPGKIDALVTRIEEHLEVSITRQPASSALTLKETDGPGTASAFINKLKWFGPLVVAFAIAAVVITFIRNGSQEITIEGSDNKAEQEQVKSSDTNQSMTVRGDGNTATQKQ